MSNTKIRATKQLLIDADFDFNAKKLTNLATPTNDADGATKAYVDGLLLNLDAMHYEGAIDCSTNPNYPSADAGHTYKCSVAGKIGGASGISVVKGDLIICNTDGTTAGDQATKGSYWNIIDHATAGGLGDVIGPASATDNTIARYDSTTGKLIQGSLVSIDDSGSLNIPSGQKFKINNVDLNLSDLAGVGTVGAKTYVNREVPSGTKNGSNADFVLAHTPLSGTEMVFLNGILQNAGAGNDYTFATATITFLTAPISTDTILVTYFY